MKPLVNLMPQSKPPPPIRWVGYVFLMLLSPLVLYLGILTFIYGSIAWHAQTWVIQKQPQPQAAIVVLGARTDRDGGPNPCLQARVSTAAAQWKSTPQLPFLVSGGLDIETGYIEAQVMQQWAQHLGVPAKAIVLEPRAQSSYQNLHYARKLLGRRHFIIVSDAFHLPRVQLLAQHMGIPHTLLAAQNSACIRSPRDWWRSVGREPLAWMDNARRGYLW